MLTMKTLPFMAGGRALRRYRADLAAQIASDPAIRLLPGLLTLPLDAAPLPDLAAILALRTSIALCAAPASGRSLALLQTAAHWAEAGGNTPPLYLALAEADLPNLPPRAVVASAAHKAGLPPELADGQRPCLLLLDDWELLPPARRALWQHFIVESVPHWSALRVIVALPAGEQWPGLTHVTLAPPDDGQLAAWLRHLLPGQDPAPMLAALRREPLAGLCERLADLVLLALTYPLGGMPTSRAQLYEHAYALVRPLIEDERSQPVGESRAAPEGEFAASDDGLWSRIKIGRALLRHYRLARTLAGGEELATVANLAPVERIAVAPLAAGLLDNPTPVLDALWATIDEPASLWALAACAREAPLRAPLSSLRLVECLAAPTVAPEVRAILPALAPVLPALLIAVGRTDEARAIAALRLVGAALSDAQGLWLQVCDSLTAPDALRWVAADLVVLAPPTAPTLLALPADALPAAMAPRAFIAALAGPLSRAALVSGPLHEALVALLGASSAGERRAVAAQALVFDPELPEELRALALSSAGPEVLERAAGVAAPALRRVALHTLASGDPDVAVAALTRILARPEVSSAARRELLAALAAVPRQAVVGVLTRATLDRDLSLDVRLCACDLLADQGHVGAHLLQRLLLTAALPAALRAAAARNLGRSGVAEALPTLAALLAHSDEPLLRRAAATALGDFGRRDELREPAVVALIVGLRRAAIDTTLAGCIAHALGTSGATSALPMLTSLLAPGLAEVLRAAWMRLAPDLERTPAFAWPGLGLPTPVHLALLDTLADGRTLADPPSRVDELAARQASCLAIAAAASLAALAVTPDLRLGVITALRRAVHSEARTEVARAIFAALAQVSNPAAELTAMLDDHRTSLNLRWLAVEGLTVTPEALTLLHRRIERGADEPFVQAMIVDALGVASYDPALPALYKLARRADADPHLRRAAMAALGHLADPEAAAALIALAIDHEVPTELRGFAAAALPVALEADERATLRQFLRGEQPAPAVSTALARALARAGDVAALPLLIRSTQHDSGAEAVTSIEAIAELGDLDAAPLLVRFSQNPLVAPGVHLAAVGALLRLSGDEHLTLLREYLTAPSPPLRLQAHAILAAIRPADPALGTPLAEREAPLALRLQALRHLAVTAPDSPLILAVVATADEQPQVRLAAATVLAGSAKPAAVVSLAAALTPAEPDADPAPLVLRRHCLLSLGALARSAGPAAEAARGCLAAIAAHPEQAVEHRHWASAALLEG